MSEFSPITTVQDLANQDDDEMVRGYIDGLHGAPEPGSNKSRSYWHGWRNGMVDSGRAPKDAAQAVLAADVVGVWSAH